MYGVSESDIGKHIVFVCHRWSQKRAKMELKIGETVVISIIRYV